MKTRALFAGLSLAAMLLAQGTVNAVPSHELVITENSPTGPNSLTVSLDGSGILVSQVPGLNETWEAASTSFLNLPVSSASWIEPEDSSLVNAIELTAGFNGITLEVMSDTSPLSSPPVADGTPVNLGIDNFDGETVFATFHDNAATAEGHSVPDAAPTAMLLGLALLGIEGLRRRFRTA